MVKDPFLKLVLKPTFFYGGLSLIYLGLIFSRFPVSLLALAVCIPLGMILWTFLEYCIHRFIFHANPKHPRVKKILFDMHKAHHRDADDPHLLNANLSLSFIVYLLINVAVYFATRSMPLTLATLVGVKWAYIGYEWVHYRTHRREPASFYSHWVRRNHSLHHDDWDRAYGFTNPVWDFLFRTR